MSTAMPVPPVPMQYGLRWNTEGIHVVPEWTCIPAINAVAQVAYASLGLTKEEVYDSNTQYLTEGAFNKVYTIQCPKGKYVMRVSLPVLPAKKTLSEVATMRAVAALTTIPVATVVDWDTSCNNVIGFEWILMRFMPGKRLDDIWDRLSWEIKVRITTQLADWMSQLFMIRSAKIGSLYDDAVRDRTHDPVGDLSTVSVDLPVGPLVSQDLVQINSVDVSDARGPFMTSRRWLRVSSRSKLLHYSAKLKRLREDDPVDSDDEEDTQHTLEVVKRIINQIDLVFPQNSVTEYFALHHNDISLNNILATDEGHLTALLDWEFSTTMPLWKTAYYPSLLVGPESTDRSLPNKEDFFHDEEDVVDRLYWIRTRSYEQTHLRPIFLQSMRKFSQEWYAVFNNQACRKRYDVQFALEQADSGISLKLLDHWVDILRQSGSQEYESLLRIMHRPLPRMT